MLRVVVALKAFLGFTNHCGTITKRSHLVREKVSEMESKLLEIIQSSIRGGAQGSGEGSMPLSASPSEGSAGYWVCDSV